MSGRRLNVTHVVHDMDVGGLESVVASLVRAAPAINAAVSVITLSGRTGRMGDQIRDLTTGFYPVRSLPVLSMIFPLRLTRVLRSANPDVVHIHSGAWFKASLAARLAGCKAVVFTEHGRVHDDPWFKRLLDRMAARSTNTVIAVSQGLKTYLAERGIVPEAKLSVIPNGITAGPSPEDDGVGRHLRAEWNIPIDAPIIGSAGRLEPVKAYDTMIHAFAILRSRYDTDPAPHLVIVGTGSCEARLGQLARDLGIGSHVHLVGWRSDVREVLSTLTIFSLSSRQEGTSISLLEAMAAGACPVVTDVGGNADVLGSGLQPCLVPADQPDALATSWLRLLHDDRHRRALSDRARQRFRTTYGLERMVNAYGDLYRGFFHEPKCAKR